MHGEGVGGGGDGGGKGVALEGGRWSSVRRYWSSSASAMGSMSAVAAVLLIHIDRNHDTNMNPARCYAAGNRLLNCTCTEGVTRTSDNMKSLYFKQEDPPLIK